METGIPSRVYKEHMLELYKSPGNYGLLENPTHEATEYNSICGDEITIQLNVRAGIVKDAKFSGSGCIISIVSSSLLVSKIIGMKITKIKKLNKFDVPKLLKHKIAPSRIKCALLPLGALKKALK